MDDDGEERGFFYNRRKITIFRDVAIFSWKGRLGRRGFWAALGFQALTVAIIFGSAEFSGPDPDALRYAALEWVARIAILAHLVGSWVLVCAFIKRLHDVGLAGWYMLFLWTPVGPIALLLFGIVPGGSEANKYGAGPAVDGR